MATYLTSDTLIASIERRAHIPEAQVTFEAEDYLALANEEILTGIIPSMMQYHEEFFVKTVTVQLIPGQDRYPIPSRAIGSKIRSMHYTDGTGYLQEMTRINRDDLAFYNAYNTTNVPYYFYLESNDVVLYPKHSSNNGMLQLSYYERPNQLVTKSRTAVITAIDFVNNIVTLDSFPSVFNSTSLYDFVQKDFAHKCKLTDITPVALNSALRQVTFSVLPSDLVVGDYLNLAGECYVPQFPDEIHPLVAQRVVCRCMEAQGDAANLQLANAKLQEMEVKLQFIIDNRAEGTPVKAANLRSPLRSAKFYGRRLR